MRNNGTVPLFFFNKSKLLVMDSPSEVSEQKFKMREQLKLEPTKAEKIFLRGQQEAIFEQQAEEWEKEKEKNKKKFQDLFCMGLNKKSARGPNPMSVKVKRTPHLISKDKSKVMKKRRPRKGKRSKEISEFKKCLKDAKQPQL